MDQVDKSGLMGLFPIRKIKFKKKSFLPN